MNTRAERLQRSAAVVGIGWVVVFGALALDRQVGGLLGVGLALPSFRAESVLGQLFGQSLFWLAIILGMRWAWTRLLRHHRLVGAKGWWLTALTCVGVGVVSMCMDSLALSMRPTSLPRSSDAGWALGVALHALGWMVVALVIVALTLPWWIDKRRVGTGSGHG